MHTPFYLYRPFFALWCHTTNGQDVFVTLSHAAFRDLQIRSCWAISQDKSQLEGRWRKSQRITTVSRIHLLGTMTVFAEFHGNPFNRFSLDQSGGSTATMVLQQPVNRLDLQNFYGSLMMSRSTLSEASSPPLCFLCTRMFMWPPAQETYCSTITCYGGNRMQRSGLECHPQATECWVSRHWQGLLALLSPWQLNYSLKERKAQGTLLISQWDCWLSSQ